MGPAAQAALFSFVDRLGGETMSGHLKSNTDSISVFARCRSYRPSTLDLHEDEHRPAPHDQIDLDAVGTDVARDDATTTTGPAVPAASFEDGLACVEVTEAAQRSLQQRKWVEVEVPTTPSAAARQST